MNSSEALVAVNTTTESPAAAFAHRFYYTSNFTWEYLTFKYHDYRYVYCVDDVTIAGEQSYLIGGFYIFLYCFFLMLSIPSLIVISRPPLINHAAYKLMLSVGIMDNVVGFFFTFLAGVYTYIGTNYCDNTYLLIINRHLAHGAYFIYCSLVVVLALNRLIELKSSPLARRLFSGRRCWLWLIPPVVYGVVGTTDWDLPTIWNSIYLVYLFEIDFHADSPPVTDWYCF